MQGRQWLYYLIDSAGKSYAVDNGLVVAKSTRTPLRHTPDGWQEVSIGWERNLNDLGVNRNFTLPQNFVLEAFQILRHLCYTKNFEEKVFLLIQKQNLFISITEYYFWYKFFYKGELDLSTCRDQENKISVSIMEGGITKDLKANENTVYEIPVDELIVKMDGARLKQSASFILLDGAIDLGEHLKPHILELMLLSIEQIQSIGAKSTTRTVATNSLTGGDVFTSKENFLSPSGATDLTIAWDFSITLGLQSVGALPGPHYFLQVISYDKDGTNIQSNNVVDYTADPLIFYDNVHHFTGQATISIPSAATETYLRSSVSIQGDNTTFIYGEEGSINISYYYRHRTTYIKSNTPETHGKRLVGKLSGDESKFISTLLANNPNISITSGDAIRGITGAVSKISFNDFFQSVKVVLAAAKAVVNGKILIESRDYVFDSSEVIELGQVKNIEVSYSNEFIYNTVKIGYPNQSYEDVNGRDEFNTTQIRTSPIKRIIKELDLVSKIRGDMYGITLTHINLDGKTTTDSTSDNDTFFLNIDYDHPQMLTEETQGLPAGTVYYNLKRQTYDTLEGLIAGDTAFNIEDMTPARLLEKHASYFNSIFCGFETGQLIWQTSDKNSQLKTIKGSVIYDEDAPFDINDTPRLFQNRIFQCEPEASSEIVEQLEANPNRCFSFIHPRNGLTYKGFNLKIGIAPNTLQEQAFQLISTPDNDLTTLK